MIYVFGDSFCYGYNFLYSDNPDRQKLIFSHSLAKKLNLDYKNYSIWGSSNQRIVRLTNFLDIKEDDIVIIGWTACDRFEVSVSKERIVPNEIVIDYQKIDSVENLGTEKLFQVIEKTENLYTRQMYSLMVKQFDEIKNPAWKRYVASYFYYIGDSYYYEQMFKILFQATVDRLRKTGCKFLMFTTWDVKFFDTKFLEIPEYVLPHTNFLDEIRYKNHKVKHQELQDYNYWTPEEHERVSEILYNALREKYDIQ